MSTRTSHRRAAARQIKVQNTPCSKCGRPFYECFGTCPKQVTK